ncbi:MAG: hypothetical protein CMC93_05570 [Flavobacteriaceae bacterium]|nr:hypothetical protein [Flavobacteriaceae bacterium]|tara:strand:- start:6830 stop:7933 length:1104 start_codon:yes stop_codon:yes gene_type:complete
MATDTLLLGEGAYAKVYTKKDSALKISEIKSLDDLSAVVRELYVLNLNLPGCVPYKSCYYKWNYFHIVLERANNSLGQLIKRTVISEGRVLELSKQLLHHVHVLHQNDIIHRDLKPDNILLKGDTLWLCDFGLSRRFTNEYGRGTDYMVTRWYRAPEIWKEEGYDKPADAWSIGCIIYRMLYRKVPGKTLKELEENIPKLTGESDLQTLIKGLLQMDPSKRWTASRALAFLGETPRVVSPFIMEDTYSVRSTQREIWFRKFYSNFPKEERVLSHGLMIFDSVDQTPENMCYSMLVACMLFKTRPSKILEYSVWLLKEMKTKNLLTNLSSFVGFNCSTYSRMSDWEQFDGDFDSYVMLKMNSKKRKLK